MYVIRALAAAATTAATMSVAGDGGMNVVVYSDVIMNISRNVSANMATAPSKPSLFVFFSVLIAAACRPAI